MAINNAAVAKRLNEVWRRLAEAIRAIDTRMWDEQKVWETFAALVPTDGGEIDDGRDEADLPVVTCQDVHDFEALIASLELVLNANGAYELVSKFCVRAPEVQ